MQPKSTTKYAGIFNDSYGGMTDTGKIIRDAWIFEIIPEDQTCEGWIGEGIQDLWRKTSAEWEKYGFLVSQLPPEIRERFDRIQQEAIDRAKKHGWDAQTDIDNNPE